MLRAVTFVTVGQTPRSDLVPELAARLPAGVEVREEGALDGLDRDGVAALAPAPGEARLVTRLAGGRQAVVRKAWVEARVRQLVERADAPHQAIVLLCTGEFPELRPRDPTLLLEAQRLVDAGVSGLCARMRRVGLLLPLAEQADGFHFQPAPGQEVIHAHASPYEGDRFAAAGRELARCDAVVMHCIGYAEEQRRRVAEASGRPTFLARRLVAAALEQL